MTTEHTGKSVSYYLVAIEHPATATKPYTAEAIDIMEALQLTIHEANIFKCIWRRASHRLGRRKRGNNALRDAQKIAYFADRILYLEEKKSRSF